MLEYNSGNQFLGGEFRPCGSSDSRRGRGLDILCQDIGEPSSPRKHRDKSRDGCDSSSDRTGVLGSALKRWLGVGALQEASDIRCEIRDLSEVLSKIAEDL